MLHAQAAQQKSKDPTTRVGAALMTPDHIVFTTGFNGFARGIADTDDRLTNRATKLGLVIHAEMNAVHNAARLGVSTKGATLYVTHPPCTACAIDIIQAGVSRVVYYPPTAEFMERWGASITESLNLFKEADVLAEEYIPNVGER